MLSHQRLSTFPWVWSYFRLIRSASMAQSVQQASGYFERIIDAGRTIGIDRATGQPTSTYTVITDAADNLITAFPGRP
jgi:hypothetical protein